MFQFEILPGCALAEALALVVYLCVFLAYLEYGPGLGSMWYRVDDKGDKNVHWPSLISIFAGPFRSRIWWSPRMWDTNWLCWLGSCLTGTTLLRYIGGDCG